MTISSSVTVDEIARQISARFDFEFDGTTTFDPPRFSLPEEKFGIGLIVGPSGSGKSTILRSVGAEQAVEWRDGISVASHFATADEAADKLAAVGLNSIPSWLRPRSALSTGEGFRADLARKLRSGSVIDEFTSVVDRNVARSSCVALRRYITKQSVNRVVLASCHYDIIDWLDPDWIFDTSIGEFTRRGALQRRPSIAIEIRRCTVDAWRMFAPHHYLSGAINKSSRSFLATWDGIPIGFASAIAFPNGNFKNGWREHRTVVLPDFQGLGVGVRISDSVASLFKNDGCRYFSKTSHPRMGGYREASPMWRPTSKNMKCRNDYNGATVTKEDGHKMKHAKRVCWSHEYVGP